MKKLLSVLFVAFCLQLGAQTVADSTAKCLGTFSVGPNTVVRFAPGNLQYQPSTGMWRFAAAQNETIDWTAKSSSERFKGWFDLFGWGTGMNPTNFSDKAADYTFVDWGAFCGLPTNGGKMWRTMSMDEWTYLLAKRKNARRLYAIAYVDNKYGMVILPDNWKCPKGVWVKPGPKEDQANWYTAEKWALLEAAGAVFLPCEAKRVGANLQGSASCCHYWTSSANKKKPAEALYILVDPYVPQARSAAKCNGYSVRLVQDM